MCCCFGVVVFLFVGFFCCILQYKTLAENYLQYMVSLFSFVINEVKKIHQVMLINPHPTTILILRMLSPFYVCCINSRALQPRFSWKQTILTQGSSLFWIHIVCSLGYLRAKADEEQMRGADDKKKTGGLKLNPKSLN